MLPDIGRPDLGSLYNHQDRTLRMGILKIFFSSD